MNTLVWIWRLLFCRHEWVKSSLAAWNAEQNSSSEAAERVAFCKKCPLAIRVKEWKEVKL